MKTLSDIPIGRRYEILAFPSLHGTPWFCDFLFLAKLIAYFRVFTGAIEVRIIDNLTGEHVYVIT